MQRWILLGAGLLVVLVGAMGFGYHLLRQERPYPVFTQMPLREDMPIEEQDKLAKHIKEELTSADRAGKVCRETGIGTKWGTSTEEETAAELGRRIFVTTAMMNTPMGAMPCINIGVTGKRKERESTTEVANRLMTEVWDILGIEPPKRPQP